MVVDIDSNPFQDIAEIILHLFIEATYHVNLHGALHFLHDLICTQLYHLH